MDRGAYEHPRQAQASKPYACGHRFVRFREVDSYVYGHNMSHRMANCHKVLPSGILDVMFENLDSVDALNFKVSLHVNEELGSYL